MLDKRGSSRDDRYITHPVPLWAGFLHSVDGEPFCRCPRVGQEGVCCSGEKISSPCGPSPGSGMGVRAALDPERHHRRHRAWARLGSDTGNGRTPFAGCARDAASVLVGGWAVNGPTACRCRGLAGE